LAGVSVPYYTRIERGDMSGVSESVLEALARALDLDEAERVHLFDLARALRPTGSRRRRRAPRQSVRPSIQHYNRMELAADPGQMLMIWTAEPGSKSAEALSLLGSWAATPQQPELQDAADHP
jgi:hypothetical protein